MGASTLTGTEFARANKNEGNYNIAWVGSYELLSQDPIANTSTLRLYGSMYTDSSTNVRSGNSSDVFKVNGVTISPPTPTEYRYSSSLTYGYSVNRYYSLFGSTDLTVQHNANGSFPSQTISIYANDYHHNAQSASGTISGIASIDRAAPTVSISLESRTDTSLKVKATANANCDVWYYSTNNGSSWTQFSTTNGTSATATITGLTKATTYNVKIKARRAYNHVEGTSSAGSYTTTDSTPPTVSASTSAVTANSCTLSASADVNCNKWEYSLNSGSSWTTFSTTNGTSASTTISGLSPATAYMITVRATRTSNSVTGTTTTSASTLGFSTFATLSNTNTGSANTFTFLSYSGSFYFRVQYKLGNTVLVTENIGQVTANTTKTYTSSYTFPHSLLPKSTSDKVTATLYTYSNSGYTTLVGSDTKTFTLSVPSSVKPSISSVTLSPYNTNSWLNTKGYWVEGFTRADVVTSATAGSGATISSIVATGDITGSGASFRSSVLSAGTKSITITVTDSRGRTASTTKTQVVQSYASPTASITSVKRGTYSGGNWTASDSGEHIRVQATGAVSLNGNVCTLHCTCTGNGSTYYGTDTTGTSATWYFTQTDAEHVYNIGVWASDSLQITGSTSTYTVSTIEVPFSWDYDRIGVGGVPQSAKTFEVASGWALRAYGKNNLFNYMPCSFVTTGQASTTGWARIARVKLNNATQEVIQFHGMRRVDVSAFDLYLEMNGSYEVAGFYGVLPKTQSGTSFDAFVLPLANNTYDVYVRKVTSTDYITIWTYAGLYAQYGTRCDITYEDDLLSSVPDGAIMVKPVPCLSYSNVTFTKTSGDGNITSASIRKMGNVCQLNMTLQMAPTSAGSNLLEGSLSGAFSPIQSATGVTYYSSSVLVGFFSSNTNHTFTVRVLGAPVTGSTTTTFSMVYLTNE